MINRVATYKHSPVHGLRSKIHSYSADQHISCFYGTHRFTQHLHVRLCNPTLWQTEWNQSKNSYSFFFLWRCDPTRVMASSFLRFIDHTQRRTTVGRTPLDKWSARRRDLYLTTHNTHNRQTSMPPVGFEPTISAGELPQTYAVDRAATGTDTDGLQIFQMGLSEAGFFLSTSTLSAPFDRTRLRSVVFVGCCGLCLNQTMGKVQLECHSNCNTLLSLTFRNKLVEQLLRNGAVFTVDICQYSIVVTPT